MEKMIFLSQRQSPVEDLLLEKGFKRGRVLKFLKNKDVRVNGVRINSNVFVKKGDEVTIFYSPDDLPIEEIIFEDENILVLNKPAGVEVEGEGGICEKRKAYAVHRLDRNTTGLLVLAKNKEAKVALDKAFKERQVTKKYLAEVVGKTQYKNFTFNAFLLKDAAVSTVKIYEKKVKGSVAISTTFSTLKSTGVSSLVECTLHTGKTHQIRTSLAYLGHAIIGDGKYGKNGDNKAFNEKRQRLHAYYLKFENLEPPLAYLSGKNFVCYPQWSKVK